MGFYAKDEATPGGGDFTAADPQCSPRKCKPRNAIPPISTVGVGLRFYSPALGRWASRDPSGETLQINIYAFVNNGPVISIDVLGLFGEGIITLGQIPEVAKRLDALLAKLSEKSVSISGGTVRKDKFTSWLAKVGPEVFLQLYAQALYDEMQAQLV